MTVKSNILRLIRDRFHPLAWMRQSPYLHRVLSSLDFPVTFLDAETGFRIAVYWYRDLPYLLDPSIREEEVKQAFLDLFEAISIKTFWDIGANIGYYTWWVNSLHKNLHSLIVEPLPDNIELLKSTVRRNNLKNTKILPLAISNTCGSAPFMVDSFSGEASQFKSIYLDNEDFCIANIYGLKQEILVTTKTLDSVIEDGEEIPDLVKVDIEGAEPKLYQGASQVIQAKKTIFIMEVLYNNTEVLQWFIRDGYDVFGIDDTNYLIVPCSQRIRMESVYRKYSSQRYVGAA